MRWPRVRSPAEPLFASVSWALYHVAIEPNLAQRLRQEVHEVLGCDANEDILPAISRQPQLLRDLKLLDAVVKESLRLHPPGSSARQPARDYLIRTEHGSFPLGPAFAWIVHYAMHLHPGTQRYYDAGQCPLILPHTDNWDDPESFRPERWLDADANAAWQPFSLGEGWLLTWACSRLYLGRSEELRWSGSRVDGATYNSGSSSG